MDLNVAYHGQFQEKTISPPNEISLKKQAPEELSLCPVTGGDVE